MSTKMMENDCLDVPKIDGSCYERIQGGFLMVLTFKDKSIEAYPFFFFDTVVNEYTKDKSDDAIEDVKIWIRLSDRSVLIPTKQSCEREVIENG